MDLGNLFIIPKFNQNEQTTWIIDKLNKNFYTGEIYDTVKIEWVLSIIENDMVYPVSFYIKHYVAKYNTPCEKMKDGRSVVCGKTFSALKKEYVGHGFKASNCLQDPLLKMIYSAFISSSKKIDTFIELEYPYCFKAQSSYLHESEGFGRSSCYYIIGISVGEPFNKPKF